MSQISFMEKLGVIWKMMSSSYIYLIVLFFFAILAYFFITTNRSNQKQSKRTYILIYILVLLVICIQYGSGMGAFFDYLMNNLAIVFYFPNIVVYVLMILTANIILWISLFYKETDKNIKILNSVSFCLIHYLLILVLGIVAKKKLDVFTLESLYSSKEAMSLIELSNLIFIIWMMLLLLYKAVKIYQIKKGIIQIEHLGGYEIKPQFDLKKAYMYESRIADFHESYQATRKIETPKLEVEEDKPQQEMFSLEDYKILLELLKEYKEEEAQKERTENATFSEFTSLYQMPNTIEK